MKILTILGLSILGSASLFADVDPDTSNLKMTCIPAIAGETVENIASVSLVKSNQDGKLEVLVKKNHKAEPSAKLINETDFTQKENMVIEGEMSGVGDVVLLVKNKKTLTWTMALYWFCDTSHCEERSVIDDTFIFMRSVPMSCTIYN